MNSDGFSRRRFSLGAGLLAAGSVAALAARAAPDAGDPSVSHANAAIHQEVAFKASAERVYRALTDAAQFDKIVEYSGVMRSMHAVAGRCQISPDVGGAFLLFGGYISGRHLELIPSTRIIQAWRSAGWPPHIHSIVRFELAPDPAGVKIVFDHIGFPNDDGDGLANGWREHYWAPLAKLLS